MARTLQEIAQHCGAALEGDGSRSVKGPADLGSAEASQVSFLANPRYAPLLEKTRAAGVLVGPDVRCRRDDLALLRVDDPGRAFTAVVGLFAEPELVPEPGVHASSVIHPSARLGEGVSVGPLCSIGSEAELADGVVLHAGVQVGDHVRVGADSVLYPNVVLYSRVVLGARCIVHSGAVIGADGFGFDPTPQGWGKVPQCGTVRVGDDVEIGANSTIDRARFGETRIADMVKIDNLVQVAHNCDIQRAALLCSQVGIAGTVTIGERVILAGQSGVSGHLEVGAGSQIGGQAGVTRDVPPGSAWSGWPARPVREVLRAASRARRVPRLLEELRALEDRIAALEGDAQEGEGR